MGLLTFLGFGDDKIKQALREGAIIIDVRTAHEYDRGRIKNSINIPLERINLSIERIKAFRKPVILCCSADGRSEEARKMLRTAGLKEVHAAGKWETLMKKVQQVRG